jgi:hypothetical protein
MNPNLVSYLTPLLKSGNASDVGASAVLIISFFRSSEEFVGKK